MLQILTIGRQHWLRNTRASSHLRALTHLLLLAELPTSTGQLLRSVALFSVVNALAEQLRSVFVPYFGLLLDACVAHLSGMFRSCLDFSGLFGLCCCDMVSTVPSQQWQLSA